MSIRADQLTNNIVQSIQEIGNTLSVLDELEVDYSQELQENLSNLELQLPSIQSITNATLVPSLRESITQFRNSIREKTIQPRNELGEIEQKIKNLTSGLELPNFDYKQTQSQIQELAKEIEPLNSTQANKAYDDVAHLSFLADQREHSTVMDKGTTVIAPHSQFNIPTPTTGLEIIPRNLGSSACCSIALQVLPAIMTGQLSENTSPSDLDNYLQSGIISYISLCNQNEDLTVGDFIPEDIALQNVATDMIPFPDPEWEHEVHQGLLKIDSEANMQLYEDLLTNISDKAQLAGKPVGALLLIGTEYHSLVATPTTLDGVKFTFFDSHGKAHITGQRGAFISTFNSLEDMATFLQFLRPHWGGEKFSDPENLNQNTNGTNMYMFIPLKLTENSENQYSSFNSSLTSSQQEPIEPPPLSPLPSPVQNAPKLLSEFEKLQKLRQLVENGPQTELKSLYSSLSEKTKQQYKKALSQLVSASNEITPQVRTLAFDRLIKKEFKAETPIATKAQEKYKLQDSMMQPLFRLVELFSQEKLDEARPIYQSLNAEIRQLFQNKLYIAWKENESPLSGSSKQITSKMREEAMEKVIQTYEN